MNIQYKNDNMIISGAEHFSLEQSLFCGQAFRWKRQENGFFGVALGRAIYAEQKNDMITLFDVEENEGERFIRYFDLVRDYGAIKKQYAGDPFLRKGMEYARGIRVLRQQPFETLISFIISSNNNVIRISKIIETLCQRYGERIGEHFDFPTAKVLASLSVQDVKICGAGYRARYIIETAKMVCDGFDIEGLCDVPYLQARQELTALTGVGPKVAECVALYSLGFTQAFPADVWMKRVLCDVYGYTGKNDKELRAFVDKKFGKHAGIVQQYLFHYARNNWHDISQ